MRGLQQQKTGRDDAAVFPKVASHSSRTMNVLRRVAVFFSLIVFVLVFALVLTGLITDFWIHVQPLERNGKVLESSFVHSGLFHGERMLDWGLGPTHNFFSVFDEITAKVSFMSKLLWALTLLFISLGLLWSFVGLLVAFVNTVADERNNVVGPSGIYLWSTLAIFSFTGAIAIFSLQYVSTIRKNVLLPEQLESGFASHGHAQLGFSFYLVVAAVGALFLPIAFIFCSQPPRSKDETKSVPYDTSVFMY